MTIDLSACPDIAAPGTSVCPNISPELQCRTSPPDRWVMVRVKEQGQGRFRQFRRRELGWMPITGFGSECVSRCTTTWRLDTCGHSANPCPALLVVVTYTLGSSWRSGHIWEGRLPIDAGPTSSNSLVDSLKNINFALQTFKRHLKTLLFSIH